MKRLAIVTSLTLGFLLASALLAEDQPTDAPAQPAVDPATDAALQAMMNPPQAPEVSDADISYTFGFLVGNQMRGDGIQIADADQFNAGLNAGLGQTQPRLNPQQINAALQTYGQKLQAASAHNKQAGQDFLAQNASNEGVTTTASGLQIKTLQEGTGDTPRTGDIVTVHYQGRLIDGTVFDQSEENAPLVWDPRQFNLIPGWAEGVLLMKEGGEYELYVPSDLAYGDRANGQIPGGSTLIFKMTLVETQTPDPQDPATAPAE